MCAIQKFTSTNYLRAWLPPISRKCGRFIPFWDFFSLLFYEYSIGLERKRRCFSHVLIYLCNAVYIIRGKGFSEKIGYPPIETLPVRKFGSIFISLKEMFLWMNPLLTELLDLAMPLALLMSISDFVYPRLGGWTAVNDGTVKTPYREQNRAENALKLRNDNLCVKIYWNFECFSYWIRSAFYCVINLISNAITHIFLGATAEAVSRRLKNSYRGGKYPTARIGVPTTRDAHTLMPKYRTLRTGWVMWYSDELIKALIWVNGY